MQPNELINLYKENVGSRVKNIREEDYNKMRRIISFALRNRIGGIFGAYTKENNLCAAAFFIETHNKAIYLFPASSEEGKDLRAMFLLIDTYINKNSENNLTLDFEGSNIESIARFYAGFGAKACEYLQVRRNKLPWWIRLFTKY